jgi:hypothetical protein
MDTPAIRILIRRKQMQILIAFSTCILDPSRWASQTPIFRAQALVESWNVNEISCVFRTTNQHLLGLQRVSFIQRRSGFCKANALAAKFLHISAEVDLLMVAIERRRAAILNRIRNEYAASVTLFVSPRGQAHTDALFT